MTTNDLSRAEILGKIKEILEDVLDTDSLELTENTTADEVEDWDSINHVKMLISLESDLGFRFDTEEVSGLTNVSQLIDVVQKKLKR